MTTPFNIAHTLETMTPAKVGVTVPRALLTSEDGILLAYGIAVPNAVAGYAPGGLFIDTSGAKSYTNTGTATSCTFTSNT